MSFYSKRILPKLLDFTMKKESMDEHRPGICGQAQGTTLEIGFGSGLNIPYYSKVTKLYALEPSRESFDLSKDLVDKARFPVLHIESSAESIPLDDESADTVISTWTLCTIPHPEKALEEICRVLKPGGKFIFIEHGISKNGFISGLQRILTPFSKRIAGGCHLDRDIEELVKKSSLKTDKIESFTARLRPLVYMYRGSARK